MLTPRYHTVTIAAGQFAAINNYGRYITIVSISASTITIAVDDDTPQQIINGLQIDCEERKYKRITLANVGGVGSTVVLYLSLTRIIDTREQAGLAGIAASLASIDADLDRLAGVAALTQLAEVNVAATGGVGTQLFAANANRRMVQVVPAETNLGYIYVGRTNAVSAANWLDVLAPGEVWFDQYYQGAVFAVGNDGNQFAGGYEL
jgi:hypothetical protein